MYSDTLQDYTLGSVGHEMLERKLAYRGVNYCMKARLKVWV